MDIERLLGSVVEGALTARGKRRRGALRYLKTGRKSLLNAGTLLAAAGVAWGLYETWAQRQGAAPGPGQPVPPPVPPPLPEAVGPQAPSASPAPDAVLRLLRLAVSAARADGRLGAAEEARLLDHARAAGADGILLQELAATRTLAEIVGGVTAPAEREALFKLAYSIVAADEGVTGGERIYLAQLAHQLGLDAAAAARLEREIGADIEAAAHEGGT
jgi:uncharacterized membrane protein YebE (DUF533 family)